MVPPQGNMCTIIINTILQNKLEFNNYRSVHVKFQKVGVVCGSSHTSTQGNSTLQVIYNTKLITHKTTLNKLSTNMKQAALPLCPGQSAWPRPPQPSPSAPGAGSSGGARGGGAVSGAPPLEEPAVR